MDLKGQLPETSGSTHLFSYLDPETIVILWAPLEIAEQAKSYLERLPDERGIYPLASLLQQAGHFPKLELSQFDQGSTAIPTLVGGHQVKHFALPIQSLQRFETEAKKAIKELDELSQTHDVTVFCENEGEVSRFRQLLDQDAPGLSARIQIPTGYLHRGFVYDSTPRPLALLGQHELFHRYDQRRRVRKVIASRPVDSSLLAKACDYVFHSTHVP